MLVRQFMRAAWSWPSLAHMLQGCQAMLTGCGCSRTFHAMAPLPACAFSLMRPAGCAMAQGEIIIGIGNVWHAQLLLFMSLDALCQERLMPYVRNA